MVENKISIGILGCANIALRSIIPSIVALKNIYSLDGIASRSSLKADDAAKQFNTKPYHSYLDLIDDDQIQAIYIPLPNSMHAEWVEKAITRGKHVLVEKSLACSLDEAKQLNKLAKENQCVLIENFQFRFHNQLQVIKDTIATGKIGELRSIYAIFGFPPFKDEDNIRYNPALGGGALLDAGAYPLKISQIFLGKDISISSAALFQDKKLGVDIWGGGFIKQNQGDLFANVAFGFDNQYQCRVEFWGSKGKLTAPRIFTAPPHLEVELTLEQGLDTNIIKVDKANHFEQMLSYFHLLISTNNTALTEREYSDNINQARLIEEFKTKSQK